MAAEKISWNFSRGPRFGSQHSHSGSQPSLTTVGKDSCLLLTPSGTGYIHTVLCRKNTHVQKISKSEKMKINNLDNLDI